MKMQLEEVGDFSAAHVAMFQDFMKKYGPYFYYEDKDGETIRKFDFVKYRELVDDCHKEAVLELFHEDNNELSGASAELTCLFTDINKCKPLDISIVFPFGDTTAPTVILCNFGTLLTELIDQYVELLPYKEHEAEAIGVAKASLLAIKQEIDILSGKIGALI